MACESEEANLTMATIKFYFDTRRAKADGTFPLSFKIRHDGKARTVAIGVSLLSEHWDAAKDRVTRRHPSCRDLNARLAHLLVLAENALYTVDSRPRATVNDYAEAVLCAVTGREPKPAANMFLPRFIAFGSSPNKKPATQYIYRQTLARIRAFDEEADQLTFEDIDRRWLERFDEFMARTARSKNARNIHLRNIRAVFNDAIDDEVTTSYPFRRFKIRPQATRKRSLSVERLRELFAYPVEPYAVRYVDMFKLIFCLCGINAVDLCNLRSVTEGRIEYERAKTGRYYSIKVEPEAQEIIDRYRGERHLLDILDTNSDHRNFIRHCNKALQRIGVVERRGRGGKKFVEPAFPGLTTYWARHSWATMAASLDIPKETIAAALGHGGNTVTDIYIDFDQRKVDEANRRVLDWVFYGKR